MQGWSVFVVVLTFASSFGHIGLSLLVISYDETKWKDVTVDQKEWLAEQFESHRARLKAVAYRMLGSFSEADDAVQEAWLRLNRTNADDVANLGGWLTTAVARVSLDMLRVRKSRREDSLGMRLPDPIIGEENTDPAHEILLADSVSLALLVVLETLAPAERLAFVLHDMFGVSFDEIALIVGRTSTAARQLASRARRRVQGAALKPDVDIATQRKIVDAFLAAARNGNFDALLDVLDPDVVVRADRAAAPSAGVVEVRGARVVAKEALKFAKMAQSAEPILVNGAAGIVSWLPREQPFSVMGFTIRGRKIVEINIFTDPSRLRRLNLNRPH
jgi:RNA polymerase sigma factor (sigma-70 family)